MSAGSHRGRRPESPDFISSSVPSPFVCPEYTNIEIEREIMQSTDQMGSFIAHINNNPSEYPDFCSSSDWSKFLCPEFRRKLEIDLQIMRSRDGLGNLVDINNVQPGNIISHGETRAQGVDGGFQNNPELDQQLELDQAEIDAEIGRRELLETVLKSVWKRVQEVNGTTRDVDLELRRLFNDEE